MQTRIVLLAALSALAGCKSTDCGDGTTEQDGTCVPANAAYGSAMCGPFTELHGTQCVPMFPPTMCGAGTEPDTDENGVTTCIGNGTAAGCAAKVACPTPAAGTQTICGQLYDFETGQAFAAAGATGAQCTTTTTTGPCALGIHAYNALALLMDPANTIKAPIEPSPAYIDDCGRYRLTDLPVSGVQFVSLAVDDAATANQGPGGVTNATGVATPVAANTATKDFEAFILKPSTLTGWAVDYSKGIYAAVFRGHSTGTDPATGVQLLEGSSPPPTVPAANTKYFQSGSANRTTVDGAATATTTNGTALYAIPNAPPNNSGYFSGTGSLPSTCIWSIVPGGSIPGAVFIQMFRPTNAPGQTCTL